MGEELKCCTARRKSALVLEIIQGKATVSEASRHFDLTPPSLESGVDEGKRGMENGMPGRVPVPFLLGSDNGLVFTSRHYTRLVRSYGLKQEFTTPNCPQQNGMVERVIRSLKEQCAHRRRFETQQHAMRVISDWIQFFNHRRPHQALGVYTRTGICLSARTQV